MTVLQQFYSNSERTKCPRKPLTPRLSYDNPQKFQPKRHQNFTKKLATLSQKHNKTQNMPKLSFASSYLCHVVSCNVIGTTLYDPEDRIAPCSPLLLCHGMSYTIVYESDTILIDHVMIYPAESKTKPKL